MKINTFQLKAVANKHKLKEKLEVVSVKEVVIEYVIAYKNTIRTFHEGLPVIFTVTTYEGQKELEEKNILSSMNFAIEIVEELISRSLDRSHYVHIERYAQYFLGEEYMRIKQSFPNLTERFIRSKIHTLAEKTNKNFKEIYREFIKEANVKELKEYFRDLNEKNVIETKVF